MVSATKLFSSLALTPRSYVNITLTASLLLVFLVLWAATEQPHFQVSLVWDDEKEALIVSQTSSEAPNIGVQAGDQLVSMSDQAGNTIELHRKFLTALPKDRRNHYPDKRSYFEDREKLYQIAKSDPVVMTFANGEAVAVPLNHEWSIGYLSSAFWLRIASGLLIWICGISVWMWKPGRPELAALGLSSTGLMICAIGQALYADIPNIYSYQFDWWLNLMVNAGLGGGGCFALGVFFYYPIPLKHADRYMRLLFLAIPAVFTIFLIEDWQFGLAVADQALYIDDWEVYSAIVLAYLTGISIVLFQLFKYRHDSSVTSPLGWSLLLIIVGPGAYVALRATPTLFAVEPLISRDTSWIVICLVYMSVVVAVARVNLFNLNQQIVAAWRWILLGSSFLTMDLVMVSVFSLNFQERLFILSTLALTACILLRQKLYQWFNKNSDQQDKNLFASALSGLLTDSQKEGVTAIESWNNLLLKLFRPVSIEGLRGEIAVGEVEESGSTLLVASNRFCEAQRLQHAQQGTRLFSDQDVILVKDAQKIFERLWDYKGAYASGQHSERRRIRRDLHDHVGHKLLSMIHAAPDMTTRGLAEEALKELGASISDIKLSPLSVVDLGNEIDRTIEEICTSANLKFFMTNGFVGDERLLASDLRRGLLSAVRESLSNIVRHSGASQVNVDLTITGNGSCIRLVIKDNGTGFDPETTVRGDGLRNISERMRELGGSANWTFDNGTAVEINLDLIVERRKADR
jgi:signal transduction histidine kinase